MVQSAVILYKHTYSKALHQIWWVAPKRGEGWRWTWPLLCLVAKTIKDHTLSQHKSTLCYWMNLQWIVNFESRNGFWWIILEKNVVDGHFSTLVLLHFNFYLKPFVALYPTTLSLINLLFFVVWHWLHFDVMHLKVCKLAQ